MFARATAARFFQTRRGRYRSAEENLRSAGDYPACLSEILLPRLRDHLPGTHSRPTNREREPRAGLTANVVTSKYFDGLLLYRQFSVLAREGIKVERATLAD